MTEYASRGVGRREHRAGLLGRARLVQGRRLSACSRADRPGLEANARRRGRARVSCPLPVCAQALRRSGRGGLRGPDGRAGLELVDPGRALSRRRHLHQPAPRARGVRPRAIPARRRVSSCWRTTTWLRGITTRPGIGFKRSSSLCPPTSSRRGSPSSTRRRPRSRPRCAGGSACHGSGAARRPGRTGSTRRGRRQSAPSRALPLRPKPPGANDQPQQPEPPPPPPASLVGVWKAQASPDVSIALTLEADGKFAWEVDTKGKKQTLTGVAGFKDNTLALLQQDGPPLVGKVTQDGANKFVFAPKAPADKAPGPHRSRR